MAVASFIFAGITLADPPPDEEDTQYSPTKMCDVANVFDCATKFNRVVPNCCRANPTLYVSTSAYFCKCIDGGVGCDPQKTLKRCDGNNSFLTNSCTGNSLGYANCGYVGDCR